MSSLKAWHEQAWVGRKQSGEAQGTQSSKRWWARTQDCQGPRMPCQAPHHTHRPSSFGPRRHQVWSCRCGVERSLRRTLQCLKLESRVHLRKAKTAPTAWSATVVIHGDMGTAAEVGTVALHPKGPTSQL